MTTRPCGRRGGRAGIASAALALGAAVLLSSCGATVDDSPSTGTDRPPAAQQGKDAASARVRFVPTVIELPSGTRAPVEPAQTVDGHLVVPEAVDHVGWWDGSAHANDPFGSTVIAGHVDSQDELGAFAQLLTVSVGDEVVVRADDASLRYRVTQSRVVDKDALATTSSVFEQTGRHRLVMITCSGRWDAAAGSYESNLVVTAEPVRS